MSSRLNGTNSGASAIVAGRDFQRQTVLGKKAVFIIVTGSRGLPELQ